MPTPTPSHTKRDPKGRFARRTTRVGGTLPYPMLWDGRPGEACKAQAYSSGAANSQEVAVYRCSRFRHETGPHVATITGGLIVHVWGDRG